MPNYACQIRLTKALRPWNGIPIRRFPFPPALAPVASFTVWPDSGEFPLTVSFNCTALNKPTSYLWDFGDGHTSNLKNPDHEYTSLGPFSPTLTVTNASGTDTFTLTNGILTVAPPPLNGEFDADVYSGAAPLGVNFTSTNYAGETSYLWDFGDGSPTVLEYSTNSVYHEYTSPGIYTVSLTVADGGVRPSNTVTKTGFIQVT